MMTKLRNTDWGVAAAIQFLIKHRWALAIIAMVFAIMLAILPVKVTDNGPSSSQWVNIVNAVMVIIWPVICSYLFLTGEKIVVSTRALALATGFSLGFGLLSYIPSGIATLLRAFGLISSDVFPTVYAAIQIPFSIIMIFLYFFSLCVIPQIIRDGSMSIKSALRGVEGRGALALGLFSLSLLLLMISMFGFVKLAATFGGGLSVGLAIIVMNLFSSFASVSFSAISVVWLLNPRRRTPEESTTWTVLN